ncbi:MAG: RDD family protein [Pseudoclavibacter sp.]
MQKNSPNPSSESIDPSSAVPSDALAGLPRRLLGLGLDWGISTLISWAFAHGNGMVTMAVWVVMQLTLVSTLGMGFGHLVFGMRVVNVANAGRPGALQVLIRTVLLALFVPGLVWGKDGRPAHDRAAGTAVVLAGRTAQR